MEKHEEGIRYLDTSVDDNLNYVMKEYLYEQENIIIDKMSQYGVSQFLLAWSLFETEFFENYATGIVIENIVIQQITEHMRLNNIIDHFFKRYKDEKLLKKLAVTGDLARIQKIYFQEADLKMLIFVIFRYRNNIFHGNKPWLDWHNYREQIKLCTEAMFIMLNMKRSKEIIKKRKI